MVATKKMNSIWITNLRKIIVIFWKVKENEVHLQCKKVEHNFAGEHPTVDIIAQKERLIEIVIERNSKSVQENLELS